MKPRLRRRPKRTATSKTDRKQGQISREVQELWGEADGEDFAELFDSSGHHRSRDLRRRSTTSEVKSSLSSVIGRVVAISSGACTLDCDGTLELCRLPSRLAANQQASIAIGDRIEAERAKDGLKARRVLKRTTVLARPDPRNHRRQRVIAANIDVVVHVASVVQPPLRSQLIDRFFVAIGRGGATPLLCVNKIELLADKQRRAELETRLQPYRRLGLDSVFCSVKSGEGLDELRSRLENRCAVFVGHSGVGKSSLLNALLRSSVADVGTVGVSSGKGQHTTTSSSLHRLADGIEIIDTPGIREFGLWRVDAADLRAAFPDLVECGTACRFSDCAHLSEPGCAVRTAIDEGTLDASRLAAYHRLAAEIGSRSD